MPKKAKKQPGVNVKINVPERMLKACKEGHCHRGGNCGAIYGLGFLGALVYYITTATSITAGIIGFFKALLWPAFLVFGLLKFLGM